MSFSDQIRRAIKRSKLTCYRIALEAGVEQSSLSRFLSGGGINITTLDAVAKVLRFQLDSRGPTKALLARARR